MAPQEIQVPAVSTAFVPSKYQQAFFDWMKYGSGNAVVEAVAGSGKTTSLLHAMGLIPSTQSIISLAFNTSIKNVMAEKVAAMGYSNVDTLTLNALGNRAWARFKGNNLNQVEGKKIDFIARKYRDDLQERADNTFATHLQDEFAYVRKQLFGIINLVRKAKVNGLVPDGVPGIKGLLADTDENWETLIDHYGIDLSDSGRQNPIAIKAAKTILRLSVEDHKTIDFDDQFYMPLIYGVPFIRPDWVFIDEAQDVSDIQREVLKRMMGPRTRLVAVGDPAQAIYGFRGANPESMNLLAQDFNCTRLPLSICYRCSKAVVEFAQQIVPGIEASPTAPQGAVTDLDEKFSLDIFKQDDMILCRNNAPLISMAYALIAEKIPCLVKGRNIGQGLVKLVEKMEMRDGAIPLATLSNRLEIWADKEVSRLLKKDEDADISPIMDKVESVYAFTSSSDAKNSASLKEEIKAMFKLYTGMDEWKNNSDDKTPETILTLSSVHKAKGLEAPRVFVLNSFLMPSKYAKKDWEIKQEQNIRYVCFTRAKKELFFITRKKEEPLGSRGSEKSEEAPKESKPVVLMDNGGNRAPLSSGDSELDHFMSSRKGGK